MNGALPTLRGRPIPSQPSRDGLRLLVAGMAYLLLICALQLGLAVDSVVTGGMIPSGAMEVRDVVALFGWVGFMICGVSVILVPNHLRVPLRPAAVPRVHLVVANVGLLGYLGSGIAGLGSGIPELFLAIVSASFLAFGLAAAATILPFLRAARRNGPAAGPAAPVTA